MRSTLADLQDQSAIAQRLLRRLKMTPRSVSRLTPRDRLLKELELRLAVAEARIALLLTALTTPDQRPPADAGDTPPPR